MRQILRVSAQAMRLQRATMYLYTAHVSRHRANDGFHITIPCSTLLGQRISEQKLIHVLGYFRTRILRFLLKMYPRFLMIVQV